ncbi:MAG: response regulator, partial [Candidatus Thiodiazotropha sp. (ex Lucinoma borealis)]|nr:response regulator [Candidatus Thiodiazotropha sp. (ex Lucinoma borealis)]
MQSKIEHIPDSNAFSDYCVLLVEDDEIMRLSLEDRLNLEQIPVRAVSNTAHARQALEEGDIDLVVTDIRLSDGTGIDLFSDITLHFPGVQVILMTAYGDVSDAVTLVKAGALDYLTKPFDINDLIDKIEHHLSCRADRRLTLNHSDAEDSFKPGSGFLGKSSAMRK